MTAGPVYLALDLGTTELKAGLVAGDGRPLASARAGYPLDADASGRAEQDPGHWWEAVRDVVAELLAAAPDAVPTAVAAVGQGPTMVAIDEAGRPTRPAATWLDTRSGEASADLEAATGRSGWTLGVLPHALRVEREEPGVAAGTRWYLNSWEWLSFRLSGIAATTVAGGQVRPDAEAAAKVGFDPAKLARTIATGALLGPLTAVAGAELGLRPGIPVVAGAVDAYSSFFGAALTEAGDAIDTGGTSGGLGVYWDAPVQVPGTFGAPAPIPGRWVYGGAMAGTGKALDWLRESALAGGTDLATLLAEAAASPPGAEGLVFLPYLAGERSPIWDPSARGAFAGLSLAHGRAHLARAVLEAAALALRHVADPIVAAGVQVRELRVSGGTARSPVWNRIKADVLQAPVAVPVVPETAMQGAAVLASVGAGDQPDLVTAMRALVRFAERLAPDPTVARTYDALYAAYTALHPAIAPIVRRLHAVTAGGPAAGAWADAPASSDRASRDDARVAGDAVHAGVVR